MKKKIKSALLLLTFSIFTIIVAFLLFIQGSAPSSPVRFSEVCHNFSVYEYGNGKFYDYIELYNCGDKDISLTGYAISGHRIDKSEYVFDDISIPAHDYLHIYTSGEDMLSDPQFLHIDFRSGDVTLYLFSPDGKLVDQVQVPALDYNTSFSCLEGSDNSWRRSTPTPMSSNDESIFVPATSLTAPDFSVESGFYSEPFYLELSAVPGTDIYYTLDGSDPAPDSAFLYTEPLWIDDPSCQENVYSARTDLSAGFFAEDDRYEVPKEPVDKAAIIRAAAFTKDGTTKSNIISKTYFVGYDQKNYQSLPVISLISDPDNFFDYHTGIYVSGETYDNFVSSGEQAQMNDPDNWRRYHGNYTNRGRQWERPVHIDYFNENRHLILSQNAGVRVRGGATRSFTQKSLNLYARSIYDTKSTFSPPFFGEKGAKDITLFSGANDYKTKIRDVLINNVCHELSFSTMESIPCYVFLDGEYWGIYHITEKYGSDYIEENFEVPKDDVCFLKNNDYSGDPELEDLVKRSDFSNPDDYDALCQRIDIQDFIAYYASEIYIARCEDWPKMNEALWKSNTITDQPYQDGKYRWMLYDLNWTSSCLSESLVDSDTFVHVYETSELFNKLMDNPQFRQDFVIAFCDIANTCFSREIIMPELDRLSVTMYEPMMADFKRFYGTNRGESDYLEEVADLRIFLQKRYDYIMPYLEQHFELQGTLTPFHLSVNNPDGGKILVNSVMPKLTDGKWSGCYYTDYPVTVTAVPAPGYSFSGWTGSIVSSDKTLSVTLQANELNELTANFTK